jgi:hypothetical protein
MRTLGVALGGLNRQLERFEQAAAEVVELTTSPEGFEPVRISTAARNAGEALDSTQNASLERAQVDLRISKYLAVANMKVLQTMDEVTEEAAKILR